MKLRRPQSLRSTRSLRSMLWLTLGLVVVVGLLFAAVFPTRTWLAQRSTTAEAESQLAFLSEQNAALADRARLLQDDAEIERLARSQYNLIRPGEEPYAILPPRQPPPPPALEEDDRNLLERAWHGVFGSD